MSATNAAETAVLSLIFLNNNWANIGDGTGLRGSSSAGSLYISLHTADPGEAPAAGQSQSEVSYTSYARVAVARSGSGWSVSGNSATNVSSIVFPACTGGSSTATHFGIGTDSSGNGNLLFSGQLTAQLAISNGITPSFNASGLNVTAD